MPSVDTTPNYPAQPQQWVESASRDLPSILQEMSSETGYGAADPGHGHRIVLAKNLVEALSANGGHTLAAASWAVHDLVQRGLLLPEVGSQIDRPIIGYRPDEDSTVVKARRFFGTVADSPRHQIPVYGEPVKKPLAPPDRPIPYEYLLVRSTPALWDWWHKAIARSGPEFSESDYDRALAALDLSLQDYAWQPGDNYLTDSSLIGAMKAQGITLALTAALFRRLTDQKVFTPWSRTIPAGHSYERGSPLPVFRSEPETTYCHITTRERWYGYLANHRRREARRPDGGSVMPTDPRETLRRHHDETQAALDKARAEAAHQAPAAELSAAWDELAQCTLASEGLSEAPSDRPRFHLAFALRLMRVANLLNVQGRLADLTRLEGKEIAIDHAINLMYYAASGVTVEELAARMQETAEEPYFIDRVGNLLRRGLRDMLGKIAAPTNVAEPASPAAPSVTASPTEPAGATKNTPLELFYSYSHKDVKLRGRLETHLSLLKREGWIVGWHDRKIGAGNEWKGQIDQHLNSAGIILLLVSADFIASDYCYDVEMKRAMERHKAGDARVIPIILKPCDWHSAPFGELQALPNEGRAVTKWKPQDEAFTDIARGLRAAVKEMTGRS